MSINLLIYVIYQSVGCATEKALKRVIYNVVSLNVMFANGTAIEGVCVTGEAIRLTVPVVSRGRVPVARRYGAIFAITANGKSLIRQLSR
jgi:hypothetical protein